MRSNNGHSGIVDRKGMSGKNNYPNFVCVIQMKQQNFKQNSNIWPRSKNIDASIHILKS